MSLWLFNIYMNGCIREMKVGVLDLGARLNVRGVEQPLVAGLYGDDTVRLAESEGMLQRIVDESDRVCKRRKLKVNEGKSKVMVFERAREQAIGCFSIWETLCEFSADLFLRRCESEGKYEKLTILH